MAELTQWQLQAFVHWAMRKLTPSDWIQLRDELPTIYTALTGYPVCVTLLPIHDSTGGYKGCTDSHCKVHGDNMFCEQCHHWVLHEEEDCNAAQ